MVNFLKKLGAIGLLLVSSTGVSAAEEGASGGPGGAGAAGGISAGAAVALGVLGVALIAVAVEDDDDDDARAEIVSPPTTTTTTTTTATTATTTTQRAPNTTYKEGQYRGPIVLTARSSLFNPDGSIASQDSSASCGESRGQLCWVWGKPRLYAKRWEGWGNRSTSGIT